MPDAEGTEVNVVRVCADHRPFVTELHRVSELIDVVTMATSQLKLATVIAALDITTIKAVLTLLGIDQIVAS